MKKYILSSFATLALLAACNDDYNDKFDIQNEIQDIKNITLELAKSDYSAIAGNEANIAIAKAKDAEGNALKALEEVGKKGYFTAEATAEDYLPAFLDAKYPYADLKSKFNVTYQQYQAPAAYLKDFEKIENYALTSEDYEGVWGNKVQASFLSPNTVGKVPGILKNNLPNAQQGDLAVVDYAYSETEPSIGGSGQAEPTWTELTTIPARATGKSWNFVNTGAIDLSAYKGETVTLAFRYTSTVEKCGKWEIKNFKAYSAPYLDFLCFHKQADGSFKKIYVDKKNAFPGAGEYVFAALAHDGKYYAFTKLRDDKTGGYVSPKAVTVTKGIIAAADAKDHVMTLEAAEGGFYIKDAIGRYLAAQETKEAFAAPKAVDAADAKLGFVWKVEGKYQEWFSLVSANATFTRSIKISDFKGNYSCGCYDDAKIKSVELYNNNLTGNEGGFVAVDITSPGFPVWKNDKIYGWIGNGRDKENQVAESHLISAPIAVPADAVRPYVVFDEAANYANMDQLTIWISTDYTPAAATMAMARAAVKPNTSVLYAYDGKDWAVYNNEELKVAVVEPEVYASLGTNKIENPETVLPTYLNSKYPYAKEEEKLVAVYKKKSDAYAVKDFTRTAGAWVLTPKTITEKKTFNKEAEGITAKISVFIDESLKGNEAGFTTQDVKVSGNLNFVWMNDPSYGWKGNGFKSGCMESEGWLISPEFDFTKATAPVLSFEEAINKIGAGKTIADHCWVKISTNYTNDVTKATWEELTIGVRSEGSSWTPVQVDWVDLSKYVGQKVRIAFQYKSEGPSEALPKGSAPTWEIFSITVKEKDAE